ncbi:MAG: Na+/H+ antiporter subunit E [Planctomycetes bacterium]|nr:Na+/H+ antiporter subunit E [Planctomycetota bacterium]MCP4861840.1 Na+/H+ antiporter subunit E [Planctomycetota bacterium]
MYYLVLTVALYLFWVLLSGHYTALLLGLGAASVLLVVWFLRRMDRVDGEASFTRISPGLFGYFGWLMMAVVKANIDVVKRIWAPNLPISPTWTRLETEINTPLKKTLYANSITLTPGTLTTNARRDHLWVHCLTQDNAKELRAGEMEGRIRKLNL